MVEEGHLSPIIYTPLTNSYVEAYMNDYNQMMSAFKGKKKPSDLSCHCRHLSSTTSCMEGEPCDVNEVHRTHGNICDCTIRTGKKNKNLSVRDVSIEGYELDREVQPYEEMVWSGKRWKSTYD